MSVLVVSEIELGIAYRETRIVACRSFELQILLFVQSERGLELADQVRVYAFPGLVIQAVPCPLL